MKSLNLLQLYPLVYWPVQKKLRCRASVGSPFPITHVRVFFLKLNNTVLLKAKTMFVLQMNNVFSIDT